MLKFFSLPYSDVDEVDLPKHRCYNMLSNLAHQSKKMYFPESLSSDFIVETAISGIYRSNFNYFLPKVNMDIYIFSYL